MSTQTEEVKPVLDTVKLALSFIVVIAGIVAFYYFSEIQLLLRVLMLLGIVSGAVGVCFTTAKGRSIWGFVLESKQEFNRVVWPTRDEAFRTTVMVFVMVVVVGFVLWLLDWFLFWAVQFLMNPGGK
jgi:preprotein translocase subunit SecE